MWGRAVAQERLETRLTVSPEEKSTSIHDKNRREAHALTQTHAEERLRKGGEPQEHEELEDPKDLNELTDRNEPSGPQEPTYP